MDTHDLECCQQILAVIHASRSRHNNPLVCTAIEHEILKRLCLKSQRWQVARLLRTEPAGGDDLLPE